MRSAHSIPRRALLAALFAALLLGTASAQVLPPLPLPPSVSVAVPFASTGNVYAEDFNLDGGGWSNVTTAPPRSSWAWGAPTSGPGVAASGANVWATRLDGDYSNYECGALVSPPIAIPAGVTASAAFREWRHMEQASTIAWDAGLLFVTADGGATYTKVVPNVGYTSPAISTSVRACLLNQPTSTPGLSGPVGTTPPPATYSDLSVDLSPFAGATVQVAVAFGSDSTATRAGWYLDDFAVTLDGATATEDFEAGDGGFTVVEWSPPTEVPKGWSWGVPLAGPTPGPGAFTMWATDPAGNHGNNECSWIESAPLDLTLVPGANLRLAWRQWFRGNFGAGGVVQVGETGMYTNLVPLGGHGGSSPSTALDPCMQHVAQASGGFAGLMDPLGGPLRDYEADLSPWIGHVVTVRFLFASTPTVTPLPGWYVDDVRVAAGAGGQSATVEVPVAPTASAFAPLSTVYLEDFNFADGGWVAEGDAWQWGDPESPPELLPGSIRLWGTRLLSDYAANECSSLTSPPLSLPAADPGADLTLARLSFNLWRSTENLFDAAHLVASADGGATWTRLTPDGGYDAALSTSTSADATRACLGVGLEPVWTGPSAEPAADEWLNVTVDLTPFMGGEVLLRFVFGSEASVERRGVYVDNVVVQVGAGASASETGECEVLPGWAVTGTAPSWCYGFPTTGPQATRTAWATNLHGPHQRGECSAIEFGPVDTNAVPGLGTLTLSFVHYFRAASTVGGGLVQVSTDGGATWGTVAPVGGYGSSLGTTPRACLAPGAASQSGFTGTTMTDYQAREVRLGSFQGDPLMVRFAFGAGTGTPDAGWYVRSVALSRGAGNVPLTPASVDVEVPGPVDALPAALRERFAAAPDGVVDMLVLGPEHEALARADVGTRADAMAQLETAAAPWFGRVRDLAEANGGEVLGTYAIGPLVHVRGTVETARAVAEEPGTRAVEGDGPGDVRLVEPIEDDSVGVSNTEGRRMLQAEEVWAAGFRGEGVVISVIDTGVDASHEAFKFANGTSRLARWANCITPGSTCDTSGTSFDDYGHGTHVAATAAGSSDYVDPTFGAFQETGVAPKATLYSVKFLDSGGGGSFADAVKSLQWSFDNGADITSNSWGSSCSASASVVTVVNNLNALGMVNVFAAGNTPGAGTVGGPACADRALSVGAVDRNGVIASFSSRGPCSDPTTGTGSRICPDLVAKGVAVRSAIPRSGAANTDPTGYKVWQGTSMATPHVAGAVALIEDMKRVFTGTGWDTANEAEKEILKMTALDLGTPGPDNTYGWGLPQLLNVYALLNSTNEANVVATFGISNAVVRLGDATALSFSVRNLGGATATGDFAATLEDPLGNVQTLASSNVALSLLDGEAFATTFTVSGSVLRGTYVFRGSFDYAWTDPETDETVTASILREGTFEVRRVFVDFDVAGLAATAPPLLPQTVTVTATNTGNEAAGATVVEFTVPDGYVFVPGDNFDPAQPMTRYADPAPTSVFADPNFGRVTLIFAVGDLAEGASFAFTTTLAPTELGAQSFVAAAKFTDGAGRGFAQGEGYRQTVGLA